MPLVRISFSFFTSGLSFFAMCIPSFPVDTSILTNIHFNFSLFTQNDTILGNLSPRRYESPHLYRWGKREPSSEISTAKVQLKLKLHLNQVLLYERVRSFLKNFSNTCLLFEA